VMIGGLVLMVFGPQLVGWTGRTPRSVHDSGLVTVGARVREHW